MNWHRNFVICFRYIPGDAERKAAEELIGLYCKSSLTKLSAFARKELEMEKEAVVLHLKVVNKCIHGASELLPPMLKDSSEKPPTTIPLIDKIELRRDILGMGDQDVRNTVFKVNITLFMKKYPMAHQK